MHLAFKIMAEQLTRVPRVLGGREFESQVGQRFAVQMLQTIRHRSNIYPQIAVLPWDMTRRWAPQTHCTI